MASLPRESSGPLMTRKQEWSAHCDTCKSLLLIGPNWYHKRGSDEDLCYMHLCSLAQTEQAGYVVITDADLLGSEAPAYKVMQPSLQQVSQVARRPSSPELFAWPLERPATVATPPRGRPAPMRERPQSPVWEENIKAYQLTQRQQLDRKLVQPQVVKEPTKTDVKEASADRNAWQFLESEAQKKYTKAQETATVAKETALKLTKDPRFQTVALGGGSGAVVVGTIGGTTGCAAGALGGAALGVVPALFTFGLSIPTGAVLGGAAGTCTGASVGGFTGLLCGMAGGNSVYIHRAEIKDGGLFIQAKVSDAMVFAKVRINSVADATKAKALELTDTIEAKACLKQKTANLKNKAATFKAKAAEVAYDKKYQSAAAGAALGGVTLGAGGGLAGAVTGAAVGIVPALFTFGLSIPVGFVMGGGTGMFLGGSAGVAAGGVAGYEVYTHGDDIKAGKDTALSRAGDYISFVKEKATCMKAKVIGGGA